MASSAPVLGRRLAPLPPGRDGGITASAASSLEGGRKDLLHRKPKNWFFSPVHRYRQHTALRRQFRRLRRTGP